MILQRMILGFSQNLNFLTLFEVYGNKKAIAIAKYYDWIYFLSVGIEIGLSNILVEGSNFTNMFYANLVLNFCGLILFLIN